MNEGTYKVKTKNYTFILDVLHVEKIYTIKFGDALNNNEGPCIELTYDTDNDYMKLDSLLYDVRCSYKQDLQKGSGTKEMIKTILMLAVKSFPKVKRIIFNDVSSIMCNSKILYLSYYYFVCHGQTWYEKYFDARPSTNKLKHALKEFKELLAQEPSKNIFSFYALEKHNTWYDYFKSKQCDFIIEHKNEIEKVSKTKLLYSEWYIRSSDILDYEVEIVSISKYKKKLIGGVINRNQLFSFEDL